MGARELAAQINHHLRQFSGRPEIAVHVLTDQGEFVPKEIRLEKTGAGKFILLIEAE
jgi:hypothetical protein